MEYQTDSFILFILFLCAVFFGGCLFAVVVYFARRFFENSEKLTLIVQELKIIQEMHLKETESHKDRIIRLERISITKIIDNE